jgi:hypothetical protein
MAEPTTTPMDLWLFHDIAVDIADAIELEECAHNKETLVSHVLRKTLAKIREYELGVTDPDDLYRSDDD